MKLGIPGVAGDVVALWTHANIVKVYMCDGVMSTTVRVDCVSVNVNFKGCNLLVLYCVPCVVLQSFCKLYSFGKGDGYEWL